MERKMNDYITQMIEIGARMVEARRAQRDEARKPLLAIAQNFVPQELREWVQIGWSTTSFPIDAALKIPKLLPVHYTVVRGFGGRPLLRKYPGGFWIVESSVYRELQEALYWASR